MIGAYWTSLQTRVRSRFRMTYSAGSNNASVIPHHWTFNATEIAVDDGSPDQAQLLQSEAWTRTTETAGVLAAASRPGCADDLTLRLRSCDSLKRIAPENAPSLHLLGLVWHICPLLLLAHRLPAHVDAMGVVDQPVENAIGGGGISAC